MLKLTLPIFKLKKMSRSCKNFILLKFYFYFFKLFGIATFNFVLEWNNQIKSIQWRFIGSKIDIFYNSFLVCSLFVMSLNGYKMMFNTNYLGRLEQDKLIVSVFDIIIAFSMLFILVIYCTWQQEIAKMANKFHNLQQLLFKNDQRTRTAKTISLKLTTFLSFGIIFLFFISFLWSLKFKIQVILYILAFNIYLSVMNSVLVQYCLVLKLLKAFFENINNRLQYILKKLTVCCELEIQQNETLQFELEHNMKLYRLISDLSQKTSNFYSLPMFGCTLIIFIDLLISCYITIKLFIETKTINISENLFDFIHIYLHVSSLSVFTIYVTNTINEVRFFAFFFYYEFYNFSLNNYFRARKQKKS